MLGNRTNQYCIVPRYMLYCHLYLEPPTLRVVEVNSGTWKGVII